MAAYFFEVYSGRTPTDGGVIEPQKNVQRAATVRFQVKSESSLPPSFATQCLTEMKKHPVFKSYKITQNHIDQAISGINDPSAGAYSQRIGKHVYGYRIGIGTDTIDAENNAVFKNFK